MSNTRGDASAKLTYSALKQDSSCIAVNMPTIANVIPNKISLCDGEVSLKVTGSNLSTPLEVTLGTVKAKSVQELPPNNGSLVDMTIDMKASSAAFKGLTETIVFFRTKYGIAHATVNLASPTGGNCP